MNHKVALRGFTLIELMLSMSFIAFMLIAIALCIIQMSTIYSRGETLRNINQAARVIATDMEDTITAAYPFNVDQTTVNAGRLCMGQFSYIWNTPTTTNAYTNPTADGTIRFVRVADANGALCSNLSAPITKTNAVELLEAGDRTLIVRSFAITRVAEDAATKQQLYTIAMALGTNDLNAIDTTANTCKPPSDAGADLTYCAVNEFSITVRAGIR